jgi:hypothetical protein
LTEPVRPIISENSPPWVVSATPDPNGLVPAPLVSAEDGGTPTAVLNISLELGDLNNPDDLEVIWYLDYPGPDLPPGCEGHLEKLGLPPLPAGTTSDARKATFDFTSEDPGCHKVEAIACDGRHASEDVACDSRACVPGAFEVRATWFLCVNSALDPDCSMAAAGCQ